MKRLLAETAARCPGGELPKTYMVFDTETTGVNPGVSRIVQYGFCLVENRKVYDNFSFITKFDEKIELPQAAVNVHGITFDKMEKQGIPFQELVHEVIGLLDSYRKSGLMFVGHNMMSFDAPLLENEVIRAGATWKFKENEIVDTGMLVKAAQLGMYYDSSDTLRSFGRKVSSVRARGVYWSLDRYCFSNYNLGELSGIAKDEAHDAGVDCALTHYLLERLRKEACDESGLVEEIARKA